MDECFNVLCVDDEAENLEMMIRVLKDTYNVFEAPSAAKAKEILNSQKIQAIVSDQRMPGMTGLEFFHEVRTNDPEIILILVTGFTDLEIVIEAVNQERIQGYFQKPFRAPELKHVLKREIERYQLARRNQELLLQTQELNAELEDLNRLKSDFLRALSNEIRMPLNSLLGCLEQIDPKFKQFDQGDYEQVWVIGKSRAESLKRLLDDLFFLLKLENLGFQMNAEPIAVKDWLRETLKKFQPQFTGKGLRVEIIHQNEPQLMADSFAISKIFQHILEKAVEFCSQGGAIQVEYTSDGEKLKFKISDSGKGSPPQLKGKSFQRFLQNKSFDNPAMFKTSISLAIAQALIEHHGGSLEFLCKPGVGNTFVFDLPLFAGNPKNPFLGDLEVERLN